MGFINQLITGRAPPSGARSEWLSWFISPTFDCWVSAICIYIYIVDMKVSDWLVVWNMAFIFHIYVYIGNHHPN